MHDVCTEQHVGNTKCARPLSLFQPLLPCFPSSVSAVHLRLSSSIRFRLRSLSLPLSLCFSRSPSSPPPFGGGKTSTIELTTLNTSTGPPLEAKKEEKRVTAASWPSVGSGVERWVNACTGQDAFLAGVGSPSKPQEWSYGVCPSPSANFHPS